MGVKLVVGVLCGGGHGGSECKHWKLVVDMDNERLAVTRFDCDYCQ